MALFKSFVWLSISVCALLYYVFCFYFLFDFANHDILVNGTSHTYHIEKSGIFLRKKKKKKEEWNSILKFVKESWRVLAKEIVDWYISILCHGWIQTYALS